MKKFCITVSAIAFMLIGSLAISAVFNQSELSTQAAQVNNDSASVEALQEEIAQLRALLQELTTSFAGNQNQQSSTPAISSQSAREIAIENASGGEVRDIMLFTDNGVLTFEVDVRNGETRYMVYVNATSGTFIRMNTYTDTVTAVQPVPVAQPQTYVQPAYQGNSRQGRSERPANPAISADRAIEIANEELSRRGISGATLRKHYMDWERGQWVWEVEFRNGRTEYEIYINVDTGEIVKFEQDWD